MPFQISPGVVTTEIDLTTVVPTDSSTDGGLAGQMRWGEIESVKLVESEDMLVQMYQKPDSNTYVSFFTAANFLQYGNKLRFSRAANDETETISDVVVPSANSAKNATTKITNDAPSKLLIKNSDEYNHTYDPIFGGTPTSDHGPFVAKYAGELGNSLKVSICPATFANTTNDGVLASNTDVLLTGTFAYTDSGTVLTGTNSLFDEEIRVGDVLEATYDDGGTDTTDKVIVTATTSNTAATIYGVSAGADIASMSLVRLKRSAYAEPARNMLGTVAVSSNSPTVTGTGTKFTLQISVGDILSFNGEKHVVLTVNSDTSITLKTRVQTTTSGVTYSRTWEYFNTFNNDPVSSPYAVQRGGSCDEIHVVVVDRTGEWTGTAGEVLEAYEKLSVASGAKAEDGTVIYYKDAVNRRSSYVYWMDNPSGTTSSSLGRDWGTAVVDGESYHTNGSLAITTLNFAGGSDGIAVSDADLIRAYDKFVSSEDVDISLLMGGNASLTVAIHLINNVAEVRKDCIVCLSPEMSDVVNATGNETENVINFRNSLPSSSYAVLDSGWKFQFDKYNDIFRYIPLNGDTAGTIVRTETERDSFYSPAGFTRGQIKGVVRLPYNPSKGQRDDLYKNGINPIVTFPGEGTILFGDKTLLTKNSAFNRINIRRLFIVMEKAISRYARFQLFEFNNEFTRGQFVGTVEPYLRSLQAAGGISDFTIVCDTTNNTSDVIDRNEFRGDIYVKPTKAINFVQLNFVAVRSGVEFSEIIGNVG